MSRSQNDLCREVLKAEPWSVEIAKSLCLVREVQVCAIPHSPQAIPQSTQHSYTAKSSTQSNSKVKMHTVSRSDNSAKSRIAMSMWLDKDDDWSSRHQHLAIWNKTNEGTR